MRYFEVLYGGGYEGRLIVANNKYEATGYYLIETDGIDGYISEVDIVELKNDHPIKVSSVGIPVYKTVEELYEEMENKQLPQTICKLIQ
ncbi:hypothetical protein [Lederbergia lenta]|uniref:hypothetical protein n=1 Tax=Lederbergia lenta TaxID=1467 RepID=UPI00203B1B1E|nr:hypothetical protein [Lederbergia lenta]MCM3109946.1 hypothetical protein [Lederbergia lenta]